MLDGVEGEEAAQATEFVTSLEMTARLHDYIAAWPEGASYLGFLFARASEPAQVEKALREAQGKLRFKLTPRLPVEHPLTHTVPRSDPV